MTHTHTNVGHVDALARRIVGAIAVVNGVMALDYVFWAMPFLTWLVYAFAITTGLFFLMGGFKGGTGFFGLLLMALTVADGWAALTHRGAWALLVGIIVAVDAFITAEFGSPLNRVLHKDTHDADSDWMLAARAAH
jgi:hypothetical protein